MGWRLAGFWLRPHWFGPRIGWEKGCGACNRLIIAGRVRSWLNGSEGLAVASRRSGDGLAVGGWRLTADGLKARGWKLAADG